MAEETLGQVARGAWVFGGGPTTTDDWEKSANAVIAAHEARRWKAIETAPKEGEFLVGRWVRVSSGLVWDRGVARYSEYLAKVWTHWTPIPAPPKEVEHGA